MPVVYLKNKRSKKQQRIVLIILLALLTFVLGLGIWYLRQQRIATQQEAGGCEEEDEAYCEKVCMGREYTCKKDQRNLTHCWCIPSRSPVPTKVPEPTPTKISKPEKDRKPGTGDVPDSCKSPPYDSCYATPRSSGCKAGFAPNSLCGPDNSWMYCCPGSPRTYGGGSSGGSSGGNGSCNPNYVIPVSLQSFSQTSGICFNNSTYEASYKVVVKAGNAQGECGGGYYKLTIRFPSSFGYGYVKSVQGPRITYSNGGAGVLNIRGWTYDNTSRTINISISVPKERIQSSQFQVAAILSADDHTSGSGTKYVTSNSDGCYVPAQAQAQGGETTPTPTPTSGSNGGSSGGASPGNTPPPTPEGPLGSIVGIVMGLALLVIGILDSQYGFISRWLEAYKEVEL